MRMLLRVNRFHKEPRMSTTRTARRRLRIATVLIAATIAAPGVATAATDLRGEYAKDPVSGAPVAGGADLRGEYAKDPVSGSPVSGGTDLRGEYAKDPVSGSPVAGGADLRGEFAQAPPQLAAAAPGADARGEFAKPEYRVDPVTRWVAPPDSAEPSDTPSALPFIVAGLVALLGFAAIAVATSLRRRVRVSH
jgi:hypothetical protein